MIKLPKLDDQKYSDIVNGARSKIPKLLPEWTDFNVHDPGITLIELLSWLKEMQQYHLDQITDKNKFKFLKLLGCMPKYMKPAEGGIVIENIGSSFTIVPGARFFAGEVTFEADCNLKLNESTIKKIVVFDGSKFTDITRIQNELDMPAYVFGEEQTTGSSLNIGFDGAFGAEHEYRLWISVFDDYPVKRVPAADNARPEINRIAWELLRDGEWIEIDKLKDNTNGFLYSGYIEFSLDLEAEKSSAYGLGGEFCWIRARLIKPGCEESPKILKIYNNYISAKQMETLSEVHEFKLSEGENNLRVGTWLSLYGELELQLKTASGGWRFLAAEDEKLHIKKDFINGICNIDYSYRPEREMSGSDGRLRVICCDHDFLRERIIGSSNGLPHQKFSTRSIGRLIKENTLVQVAERDSQGNMVFYDWSFTDDINVASGNDRVFSVNNKKMELYFGDNENGLIPTAGVQNILHTACSISEGENGNTNSYEINDIYDCSICTNGIDEDMKVFNFKDCAGGQDEETVEVAMTRLRRELGTPSRAVTEEDFEYLVRSTPGLRIFDVKAVPQNNQGNMNVMVIVVPYSSRPRPKPDKEYMEIIRKRLEKFRLIGSSINMVEPQYVEISVYAEVVPQFYTDTTERDIVLKLNNYLDSSKPGRNVNRLGEPIFESDIISFINSLENVSYVRRVSLSARGNGWSKTPGGDIYIPFNSVVCPGSHEISLQEF